MRDGKVRCPICKETVAVRIPAKCIDTDGFRCERDGEFEVSWTALITKRNESTDKWEQAKLRSKKLGERPCINDDDFNDLAVEIA